MKITLEVISAIVCSRLEFAAKCSLFGRFNSNLENFDLISKLIIIFGYYKSGTWRKQH